MKRNSYLEIAMDISREARKSIMLSLLYAISQLSDEEYLQKAWVERKSPEDFDEFTNNYLREFESMNKNYKFFGLSEFQHEKWDNFYKAYHYFCYNNQYDDNPELFIHSSEWREIMALAQEVLKVFNYNKKPNCYRLDRLYPTGKSIVACKSLPNYRVWIRFDDGLEGEVDLSHLVGKGVFAAWKSIEYFNEVRLDPHSETLAWGDEIELDPIVLRESLITKK